ncbi:MAG: alanine--tRNA ligase [Alphaproteobacteria bacterium]|nr:alanine--tRNA ligase [Alphaproteobacteria bacterium]
MQSANDIRSEFLDYFRRHGHEVVDSSPLVPRNDPTLMFTNAGMVQFKNVFTGAETRPYKRAVTAQKCVRAGGKHNDLENVGHTARHHTFFEMLGNFSFGDYFKDVAIELAWNLVTREYGLPADRLLVTVYAEDDQAFELWRKIAGLPESKVIRIATSDNFWAMGETGPCGPCSEIFYDHGPDIPGGPPGSPDEEGDRFVEIWNLVFMQYEQVTPDKRIELPRPSIDTGLGLERTAAVMQGKHDNYDVDLMRALVEASAEATGTDPDGPGRVSHRVIADHLRACSFLIADGVMPSNEGRGYVLRRIMRRAMRHAEMLGAEEPVMWRLVPALVRQMGGHFTELRRAEAAIAETFKLEESNFKRLLARGLRLLAAETAKLGDGQPLPGDVAFKLYDTYGFPLDLTQDALRDEHRDVDTKGFDAAMERQRAEARKARFKSGEAATEAVWFDLRDTLGATEFLGYSTELAEGVVTALLVGGKPAKSAPAGTEVTVIVNQTPFYGESGGQLGDTGVMAVGGAAGARVDITDTQKKLGDLHAHIGTVAQGTLHVGDALELHVDGERRTRLRANHSVTHLLHEALRRLLGDHVTQKGSLVAPDYLRFDFAHPKPVAPAELRDIEAAVNARIRENTETVTRLMTPDAAIEAGALALFGEKYGDEVRVVSMGGGDAGAHYSTELCGGTHVPRTGDIGLFVITAESAVASGVRRIEAVTGAAALDHVHGQAALLGEAAGVLRTGIAELPARVAALLEERRRLERELADARKKLATGGGGGAAPEITEIGGVRFVGQAVDDVPPRELKPMVDSLKQQLGSGVAAVVSSSDGKASLVVGVTEDLTDRISAVDLVRAGSAALGGKGGGGRPDMAQAGGPDGAGAAAAIEAIRLALAGTVEAAH